MADKSPMDVLAWAGGVVASVYRAATRDGHLAAAGRQGVDEIGQALKAFPEAIQAQEQGTIFNPTPGEIAADRRAYREGVHGNTQAATPSEIAREKPQAQPDRGHERGREEGHENGIER